MHVSLVLATVFYTFYNMASTCFNNNNNNNNNNNDDDDDDDDDDNYKNYNE